MELPLLAPPPKTEGLTVLLPPPKMEPPPAAGEPKPVGLIAAACPKMLPPVAAVAGDAPAALPKGEGLLVTAAVAKRPLGGAAALVANTLASGFATLPNMLPVGGEATTAALGGVAPNGLLTDVARAKAFGAPKIEPDVLLVTDVVELVVVTEPLGAPLDALKLLNSFEKEKVVPIDAVVEDAAVLAALMAGAAAVAVVTAAVSESVVVAGVVVAGVDVGGDVAAAAAVTVAVVAAATGATPADLAGVVDMLPSATVELTAPPNKLLLASPPAERPGKVLVAPCRKPLKMLVGAETVIRRR